MQDFRLAWKLATIQPAAAAIFYKKSLISCSGLSIFSMSLLVTSRYRNVVLKKTKSDPNLALSYLTLFNLTIDPIKARFSIFSKNLSVYVTTRHQKRTESNLFYPKLELLLIDEQHARLNPYSLCLFIVILLFGQQRFHWLFPWSFFFNQINLSRYVLLFHLVLLNFNGNFPFQFWNILF